MGDLGLFVLGHMRLIKERVCDHDLSTPTTYITSDPYDETESQFQGWVTSTYFSRSQMLIKKSLSSRYLYTYNLYYFHINTSDSYDKTQGQVQSLVT